MCVLVRTVCLRVLRETYIRMYVWYAITATAVSVSASVQEVKEKEKETSEQKAQSQPVVHVCVGLTLPLPPTHMHTFVHRHTRVYIRTYITHSIRCPGEVVYLLMYTHVYRMFHHGSQRALPPGAARRSHQQRRAWSSRSPHPLPKHHPTR